MDEKAKKQSLLMIPYGLFVLGAAHGGTATAATVNWVTQASFNPPLVVVGIKKDSGSHAMVKDSKKFALSMLAAGQKIWLAGMSNPVRRVLQFSAVADLFRIAPTPADAIRSVNNMGDTLDSRSHKAFVPASVSAHPGASSVGVVKVGSR